jgi:uncharacterized protein (TIGR00251 family)
MASPEGLTLHLRVTPNAGIDRIEGFGSRDDGSSVLRVRVRAAPDKGKANAAMIALLAKALGVPKSAVTLVSGETARHKTVRVVGDVTALAETVAGLGG